MASAGLHIDLKQVGAWFSDSVSGFRKQSDNGDELCSGIVRHARVSGPNMYDQNGNNELGGILRKTVYRNANSCIDGQFDRAEAETQVKWRHT